MKRTKIICTIGPASEQQSMLESLISGGMNLARLNLSHGNIQHHRFLIRNIRAAAKKFHAPIAIIADLQGPKIRTGSIPGQGIEVRKGEDIVLAPEHELFRSNASNVKCIPLQFPGLAKSVKPGQTILIDDGLIVLKVKSVRRRAIFANVSVSGTITAFRGLNVPGVEIKSPVITEKDRKDIAFLQTMGVDYFAMSFVRRGLDIDHLRLLVNRHRIPNGPKIIAKVENAQAVNHIDDIIEKSDAIMIARGDLGLELPAQMVPIIQKQIITKCLRNAKPVIVATQMLESMIRNIRPTRAEVSDVSNAVVDHADAVMLSAETAFGRYPFETVSMMRTIIEETEQSPYDDLSHGFLSDQHESLEKAVAHAAHELSKNTNARAILMATTSGFSARLISRHRPQNLVTVALTSDPRIYRQLSLLWGVTPFLVSSAKNVDAFIRRCILFLRQKHIAKRGDAVVIVTGQPLGSPGIVNLIKVQKL